MNSPLVSVIIPTYNRAHLISETLDSILAQTYTNWECIVVDDGSVDNTDDLLKEYCQKDLRIQYHHRPDDYKPGGNGSRNFGYNLSTGEYIIWFDSDDLMERDYLKKQMEEVVNVFDMCIGETYQFSDLSEIEKKYHFDLSNLTWKNFFLKSNFFLLQNCVYRRTFLNRTKVDFNEELIAGQDFEFNAKLLANYPILSCSNGIVKMRSHNDNITQGTNKNERDIHYLLARIEASNYAMNIGVDVKHHLIREYFCFQFKKYLFQKKYEYCNMILIRIILGNKTGYSLIKQVRFASSLLCFRLFNRGNFLLPRCT